MNWDHIAGSWEQFSGPLREQWCKLTIKQLELIAGNREHMSEKIQEAYGISKSDAEQQIDSWLEQQPETAYLIERATERNGALQ